MGCPAELDDLVSTLVCPALVPRADPRGARSLERPHAMAKSPGDRVPDASRPRGACGPAALAANPSTGAASLGTCSSRSSPIHLAPVDAVDEHLADVAEQVGLRVEDVVPLRLRGNSAQQMAAHGRRPSRESVVVIRN